MARPSSGIAPSDPLPRSVTGSHVFPRIEDHGAACGEVLHVIRDHTQAVSDCGCGDQPIARG